MCQLERKSYLLGWEKASIGDRLVWIGTQLSVEDLCISVSTPKDKLDAFHSQTVWFLSAIVAQKNDLQPFCGKLSFVAGMVPALRPFVDIVWAALASSSRFPLELVHCRRFWVAAWLQALFAEVPSPFVRVLPVTAAFAQATISPQMRALVVLLVCLYKFQACGVVRPTHEERPSQVQSQHWEAIPLLVAVRLWLPGTRVSARVRSDSLSGLRSMLRLSSKSANINVAAGELALDAVLGFC